MEIVYLLGLILSGVVTDKTTNEPLSGVEVKVGVESFYTDLDGRFSIDSCSSNTLEFSYVSYSDTTLVLSHEDFVNN